MRQLSLGGMCREFPSSGVLDRGSPHIKVEILDPSDPLLKKMMTTLG
jgi:hypothetical protein